MQTCDICTKLQLTNYLIFSLSISILRMGVSGPGHSTRGERAGPGQEDARQTSVADICGGAAEQKSLDFVGAAAGFCGRSRADLPLARKFGFCELAGFSLRSLSDLSVARQSAGVLPSCACAI